MIIVEFCGAPGCGKTYLCDLLERKFAEKGFKVQNLHKRKKKKGRIFTTICRITDTIKYCYFNIDCSYKKAVKDFAKQYKGKNKSSWLYRLLAVPGKIKKAERDGVEIVFFDEGPVQYISSIVHEDIVTDVDSILDYIYCNVYNNRGVILNCKLDLQDNIKRIKHRNRKNDRFIGENDTDTMNLLQTKIVNIDAVFNRIDANIGLQIDMNKNNIDDLFVTISHIIK